MTTSSEVRKREEPRAVVQQYVATYDTEEFQVCLRKLEKDSRGFASIDIWAQTIYERLRDNPEDEHMNDLNSARKTCLNLLYEMVDKWNWYEENGDERQEFEEAIKKVFKQRRLERILAFCLPMDRAQALYKMVILPCDNIEYGMHWYSKLHLEENTEYAQENSQEQTNLKQLVADYSGKATMNKRLFRLLYSKKLGFQKNKMFAKWSRPQRATFVKRKVG